MHGSGGYNSDGMNGNQSNETISKTYVVATCATCHKPMDRTPSGCACKVKLRMNKVPKCVKRCPILDPCEYGCYVDLWAASIYEALGTMFLVLAIAGTAASGGSPGEIAFAAFFVLAALIYFIGVLSGGHFNPIVTCAFFVLQKLPLLHAICYCLAQFIGGIAAGAILLGFFPKAGGLGTPVVGGSFTVAQAFGAELLFSFVLVLGILHVSIAHTSGKHMGGFAIAAVLGAAHLFGVTISGAALNPARAVGPAIFSGIFTDHWIYWAGPAIGAAAAAAVFWVFDSQGQYNHPALAQKKQQ